jgi:hypothetical protein
MKIYHQTGFRENWNMESFSKGIGDGLIFSPINIEAEKLSQLDESLKNTGFLDPQLYLLNEAKGKLDSYPYFPGNIHINFATADMDTSNDELAQRCVDYQASNKFNYLVVPTRHYQENPSAFLAQSSELFVRPFVDYVREKNISTKVLLSVIIKPIMLSDEGRRDEMLNWITGHLNIHGVYLIFENNFTSKQIKDFDYLLNALRFIRILRANELEVIIGYTNTEAVIYSAAMPDAVTIGSYENLRSFSIARFRDVEKKQQRPPNARLYSSKLFQWIDYEYIQAMKKLVPGYETYFENSEYKPLMFQPDYKWHFAKPQPYQHYFYIFNQQIKSLPDQQMERIANLKSQFVYAVSLYKEIQKKVLLDSDSDGSHLPTWHNVLNAFEEEISA